MAYSRSLLNFRRAIFRGFESLSFRHYKYKVPNKRKKDDHSSIAKLLAIGAVALVLIIAIGAFGRAWHITIVTGVDHPISDAATQLLTALGSALVGGAVAYISSNKNK